MNCSCPSISAFCTPPGTHSRFGASSPTSTHRCATRRRGRRGFSRITTTSVTARATAARCAERAAAVLLLTLRGTPFLFQGEELGLADVVVRTDERVDPGGRDGPRGPIPWTTRFPHG